MTIEWLDGEAAVEDPPPPRLRGTDRRIVVVIVCLAVLAAAGVGYGVGRVTRSHTASVRTLHVAGAVELQSNFVVVAVGNGTLTTCLSSGSLTDLAAGTPVVVTDVDQRFVGATRLAAGQFVVGTCRFAFSLDVPATGSVYEFQIGNRVGPAVRRPGLGAVTIKLG